MLKLFYSNLDLVVNQTLPLEQFQFSVISACAPWQAYLVVEKLFDIIEMFNVPIDPLPIAIVNKLKVEDLKEGVECK